MAKQDQFAAVLPVAVLDAIRRVWTRYPTPSVRYRAGYRLAVRDAADARLGRGRAPAPQGTARGRAAAFGRYGFEDGVSGHITARDPEYSDCFRVNPFGMPLGHITVSDLLSAEPMASQAVEGRYHVNQAGFTVHAQVHAARPDVVAVAPCHSRHGRAPSALGDLKGGASPGSSARTRRWCCATTGCSPSATRWTPRPGGCCRWSGPARRS
ncbi:hypothetical protein GCM10010279_11500 [Streptomyces mutabilis]|nr:hypothetical protein GCM10010279_11500 [Streptomyces mutabilis]